MPTLFKPVPGAAAYEHGRLQFAQSENGRDFLADECSQCQSLCK
jgi:hypothetical protein